MIGKDLPRDVHPICPSCYFNRTLEGRLREPVEMNYPLCEDNQCCFCGVYSATRGIYMKAKQGEAVAHNKHSRDQASRVHNLSEKDYEGYILSTERTRRKSIDG